MRSRRYAAKRNLRTRDVCTYPLLLFLHLFRYRGEHVIAPKEPAIEHLPSITAPQPARVHDKRLDSARRAAAAPRRAASSPGCGKLPATALGKLISTLVSEPQLALKKFLDLEIHFRFKDYLSAQRVRVCMYACVRACHPHTRKTVCSP